MLFVCAKEVEFEEMLSVEWEVQNISVSNICRRDFSEMSLG